MPCLVHWGRLTGTCWYLVVSTSSFSEKIHEEGCLTPAIPYTFEIGPISKKKLIISTKWRIENCFFFCNQKLKSYSWMKTIIGPRNLNSIKNRIWSCAMNHSTVMPNGKNESNLVILQTGIKCLLQLTSLALVNDPARWVFFVYFLWKGGSTLLIYYYEPCFFV